MNPVDPVDPVKQPLLVVEDLTVRFAAGRADGAADTVTAVDGLSFSIGAGGSLGLVGESGSGKTTVAAALLGLHSAASATVTGSVRLDGTEVVGATEPELRALRGARAAMVFQDPLSALDPYWSIGAQIAEVYRAHSGAGRAAAEQRAVRVLDRVGIPDAARRARAHPHEFSGGMRQRALIAMALACEPKLLIADEPTTALDVTVQAQILDLLAELRAEHAMALLLVTHDLGVVAGTTERVLVMSAGRAVEQGEVGQVLGAPSAPYTRELVAAVPRLDRSRPPAPVGEGAGEVLMRVRGLRKEYPGAALTPFGRRARVPALDGVDLDLHRGEALGVVGESGSGKTTLGRLLVRLLEPTTGLIEWAGRDIGHATERALRPIRQDLQMVFQDPLSSLNPRRTIGDAISDPLRLRPGAGTEAEARREVGRLLERVGLDPAWHRRYPHELSGGQRQRVGIARALAPGPRLLVCDEPVSSLDVSTQAQVVSLLGELQAELGLTLVFIAHDLAVVRQVSDRIAVMRAGHVVELGPADEVYQHPQHPYTRSLLAAVPLLDPAAERERRRARAALGGGAEQPDRVA
ncbi:ABC transporter ATP-binding protein [Kitasatospora sp. NBC_01287]|uniref:ABC transporter ATP-binding protein n=1 Tax=Kitasatospora sp. NBC_01287 TaxID=2903573 RepID=UPI002255D2C6|nr:ABC transporter ATP-binding protein [Kitasatospora sp. NBC_01287]MCX4744993.1 ABC transporter ATP-binding protein [Kitasatospora sp. NBC_01287]